MSLAGNPFTEYSELIKDKVKDKELGGARGYFVAIIFSASSDSSSSAC